MVSYRTALSRARGLGSAKHGAGHWLSERLTSIALVPLTVWGIYSTLVLATAGHAGAVRWLSSPLNAVLLLLLIAIGLLHMHAGVRVVVEDYLHTKLNKGVVLLLNLAVCVLGAALAMFSVLRVALGAAA